MKLQLLCAGVLLSATSILAYDLDTRALSPVKHGPTPQHQNLQLVSGKKLQFAIVTDSHGEQHLTGPQANNKSIAPAVQALVKAFEHCTGQTPAVVEAEDAAALEHHAYWIVVGDCTLARAQGVDWKAIPEQGFVIKTFPRGVLIVGHDTTLLPERESLSRGTLYGVYDFTERFLGVRYFYPGDIGTHWPQVSEFVVAPANYSDSPRFMNREGGYHLWLGVTKPEDLEKYGTLAGNVKKGDRSFGDPLRFGAKYLGSSHNPRPEDLARAFPDRLKTIFYTTADGKFFYNPKEHLGNLYNVVDLEFADLLIDVWKAAINGDEMIGAIRRKEFIGLGATRKTVTFGNCDTYQSAADIIGDPVVRELNLITPADEARPPNALMANVYARFYQYLCSRLEKELPGANLCILAYYNAEYAPVDPRFQKLPSNLLVNLCNSSIPKYITVPEYREAFQRQVKEWVASTGKPIHRLWLYDEYRNPFVRAVIGEYVGEVPKALGDDLGDGALFLDSGFQFPYYTSFYAAFRSMWNPDWDVEAGIAEHWPLFYGEKAGAYLAEFHRILKHDLMAVYHQHASRSVAIPSYPPAKIDRLEELLKLAEAELTPDSIEMRRFRILAEPWADNFKVQRTCNAYQLPVHVATRLLPTETLVVDGDGSDPCWQRARPVRLIDHKGSGLEPRFPVDARLIWDDKGIYGLFTSPYPPVQGKSLWFNSSYEVFFMPGAKAEQNYQFAFDPEGNKYFGKRRYLPLPGPTDPNHKVPGWIQKNTVSDDGWTVEFFIPYAAFEEETPPKAYDTWRFNLVSNRLTPPAEVTGSALTLGNHHNIDMYGRIVFGGLGD